MVDILDSKEYMERMLGAWRPGAEKVLAFYEHRVDAICKDPRLMLMLWDDHLVHRGDGIFESMKWVDGKLYQLDPHLRRMRHSAAAINLAPPCEWEKVRELIIEVARAADTQQGMIRVLLGRGPGGFALSPLECPATSLYIAAYVFNSGPEERWEKGVSAFRTSIPAKQPYMATIKSIDYLPNVLMSREATEKGYDYPFCFDAYNFLAEGATENICLVNSSGVLVVPEFTNCLAGTTMRRALDLIAPEIEINYSKIKEDEIYDAREVILLGTSFDALSVIRYRDKPIHDVRPGPVSKRMRELLKQDLAENGIPLKG